MEKFEWNNAEQGEKKESKKVSDFLNRLKTIAVLGSLLGLTACNSKEIHDPREDKHLSPPISHVESAPPKEITPAQKILNNFPTNIPGAAKNIMIENVEGAQKVMIVVNNMHIIPPEVISERKEPSAADLYWELQIVDARQRDSEKIFRFLSREFGVKKIYTEGESEKTLPETKDLLRSANWGSKSLTKEVLAPYDKAIRDKVPNFPLSAEQIAERFPYVLGAPFLEFEKGKIDLVPAEDYSIYSRITLEHEKLQAKYPDSGGHLRREDLPLEKRDEWDLVFHKREENVMRMVAEDKELVSVVFYGGGHYWGDNTSNWNTKNPDRKIALAVINPESPYESFATRLLLNSGFTPEQDSWIEFHFRDYLETLEKLNVHSELFFLKGEKEIRKMQKSNGLSDKEIASAIEAIKQAAKDKREGLHNRK